MSSSACYLHIGNIEASRNQFLEAIKTPKHNTTYLSALINLGNTYFAERHFKQSIELYRQALTETETSSSSSEDRSKVKSLALYSLAKVYSATGDVSKAREYFQEAHDSSSPIQRPAIMLAIYQLLETPEEKARLLTQCVDLIIRNGLHPDSSHPEGILELTTSILYTILRELYLVSRPLFDRLFTYTNTLEELKMSGHELLLQLDYLSAANNDATTAISMVRDLIEKPISNLINKKETEFQSYRLLSLICKGGEKQRYQLK